MTLGDLIGLIKRYWKPLILVVCLCTVLGLGYGLLRRGTYYASAIVTSSVDLAALKGQAEASASQQNGVKVSVTADTTSKTVKMSGEGSVDQDVVKSVNDVAKSTEKAAKNINSGATVSTSYARQASYSRRNPLLYAAVGFAGGIVVALCALVFLFYRRLPVRDSRELEKVVGLPTLGTLPSEDDGKLLAANIVLCLGEDCETVCLVSVSYADADRVVSVVTDALASRQDDERPHVIGCQNITADVDALFAARRADAVILIVTEWHDSMRDVDRCIREFKIVKGNLKGLIYCRE